MVLLAYISVLMAAGLAILAILAPGKYSRVRLPAATSTQLGRGLKLRSLMSGIFPFTGRVAERLKIDQAIKKRIAAAHVKMNAQEYLNLKILLMIALGVVAYFALGKVNLWLLLTGLSLGYIIPDLWLRKKIHQHKEAIARLLPETVDLLGLCVEAGLDFTTAVRWVIDKVTNNPLIEEFAFVLEEIKWGKPRTQALKDMSRRLNISEVSSFVQTLVQAERMGTPVAEAFAILSEDTRMQRFHRGERFAMQAPIKILMPLIFCILPVIGIVIGGPIFLQFMQGGVLKGLVK